MSGQTEQPTNNMDGATDEVAEDDPDVDDATANVDNLALEDDKPKKKKKKKRKNKVGKKRRHITGFEGRLGPLKLPLSLSLLSYHLQS